MLERHGGSSSERTKYGREFWEGAIGAAVDDCVCSDCVTACKCVDVGGESTGAWLGLRD